MAPSIPKIRSTIRLQLTSRHADVHSARGPRHDQTVVYLMRHAETDWPRVNERGWVGLANDFAPLTERGRQQAADAASHVAEIGPTMLLTSPMTRAMETAAILGRRIGLDPIVEIDLREWLPDRRMAWSSPQEVQAAYVAMIDSMGAAPGATVPRWEAMSELRRRGLEALTPYIANGQPVLAVCHEVIIHAITGCPRTGHCEVRKVIDATPIGPADQ